LFITGTPPANPVSMIDKGNKGNMILSKLTRRLLLAALIVLPGIESVKALPTLQLDIQNGVYDSASQTIVNTSNPFNLWALLDTTKLNSSSPTTYYISAAITPRIGPEVTPGQFGSFSINGTSSESLQMQYGTPPVCALYPDLPGHAIYPTYYAEIAFTFDPSKKALGYDTALNPGGLTASSSGTLLYNTFYIDVTGLAAGYELHLDFYDEWVKTGKKTSYEDDFAPFSHDAEGHPLNNVPDGGSTLALMGLAFVAIGLIRRKVR
jgi:hypothetical protein